MIQVNLLPDIKLEFLKTQRNKRLIVGIAVAVSITAVVIASLLALQVYVNQAIHTKALQDDIDSSLSELRAIDNLDTILTVSTQLEALPALHEQKPVATRLPDVLEKVVPAGVGLSEIIIDFDLLRIRAVGHGINSRAVNEFADILKNTFYSTVGSNAKTLAFYGVEFDIGVGGEDGLPFETNLDFDIELFDNVTEGIEISIPTDFVSTQSSIDNTLFNAGGTEE